MDWALDLWAILVNVTDLAKMLTVLRVTMFQYKFLWNDQLYSFKTSKCHFSRSTLINKEDKKKKAFLVFLLWKTLGVTDLALQRNWRGPCKFIIQIPTKKQSIYFSKCVKSCICSEIISKHSKNHQKTDLTKSSIS